MKWTKFLQAVLVAATLSEVAAHPAKNNKKPKKERIGTGSQKTPAAPPPVVPTVPAKVNGLTISVNTSSSNAAAVAPAAVQIAAATNVKSTILIFARDTASAFSAYSGLRGYAIPYQVVVVPKTGVTLPQLTSSTTAGNYGAIVILSEVSYDYGGTIGFASAITAAQWTELYQYQVNFGARMVRLDVFPGPAFGATALGGCCNTGVEQLISLTSTAQFPTSGMKINAGVSTAGLWHYPASITNATIATQFAAFAPAAGFPTASVAGVINNISGRQQMVFFISWATEWAQGSNYLQHAWIHWVTRGLYTGYRRINLGTQVDDMFLISDIYSPAGNVYRVTTADLNQHKTWTSTINGKLPTGSNYFMEIAHNGNGNIEASENASNGVQCGIGPIDYPEQIDTPLEFKKPLGTGVNLWPSTPASYPYTNACLNLDPLKVWWANSGNRDVFAHLSHTFTHEDENNATYFDVNREISWNKAWLTQSGIGASNKFSPKGIVPPAITGLHNGDAIKAWLDNGITNVVGDNTRPALLNTQNEHWPLTTNVADNGYAGVTIIPRWATNIYYNCDLPACTVAEWQATAAGNGDWNALLALEKATNTRHLFGLRRDPFMFHQANMNYVTAGTTTINGVTTKLSLIQAWVETIVQEMVRLTTWPIITLKHDDIATAFRTRVQRDNCNPSLTWNVDPVAKTITGVTVNTNGNTCATKIPVTVPGTVTSTTGHTTEKIGSDPLTIWVTLSGNPVTFTLTTPVPF